MIPSGPTFGLWSRCLGDSRQNCKSSGLLPTVANKRLRLPAGLDNRMDFSNRGVMGNSAKIAQIERPIWLTQHLPGQDDIKPAALYCKCYLMGVLGMLTCSLSCSEFGGGGGVTHRPHRDRDVLCHLIFPGAPSPP